MPPTSRRAATGFLLLLAVLLLAAPQQADAQRARTLVSNIRGGNTSGASVDRAQRFTTGPGLNSGGYTLSSNRNLYRRPLFQRGERRGVDG